MTGDSGQRTGLARIVTLAALLFAVIVGLCLFARQESSAASSETRAASRTPDEQRTIEVYKRTNAAVVFILTKSLTIDPLDAFPEIHASEGSGSGIVVDSKRGIIITNFHVIRDASKVEIMLADGLAYPSKLVGFDRELDIAVLQLRQTPESLPQLEFGDSRALDVGQRVLAIGNPFGLNRTLTTGIISSLDRIVRTPEGFLMRGLIQTDAAINPGNSGGPLLDSDGRLIGMTTAILSQSGDSAGIGFAVPIHSITRVLPELIATGRVLRPSLGWVLVDTNHGAMVRWVEAGGPADRAGVEGARRSVGNAFLRGYILDFDRADMIVSINGTAVSSRDEIEELVGQAPSGKPIEVVLRRGGRLGPQRTVSIRPELK